MRERYSYYAVINGSVRPFTTLENRDEFINTDPKHRRIATKPESERVKLLRSEDIYETGFKLNEGTGQVVNKSKEV